MVQIVGAKLLFGLQHKLLPQPRPYGLIPLRSLGL